MRSTPCVQWPTDQVLVDSQASQCSSGVACTLLYHGYTMPKRKSHRDEYSYASADEPKHNTSRNVAPVTGVAPRSLAMLCAAIGAAIYLNTGTHGWTLDDFSAVVGNKDALADTPIQAVFMHDFWGQNITLDSSHKSYRPITTLTFRANFAMHGMNPHAFHQTNVALYSVCCFVVVIVIFSKNFATHDSVPRQNCVSFGAVAASLWWTVHPIHTEAVASVVGRAEILSATLCFVALAFFERIQRTGPTQSVYNVVNCVGFFVSILAGTLCKEIGITMCVVAVAPNVCTVMRRLVTGTTRLHEEGSPTKSIQSDIHSIFGSACLALAYLAARRVAFGSDTPKGRFEDNPLRFVDTKTKVLTALYLQTINLKLLLYPDVQSSDYSFDAIPLLRETTDARWWTLTVPFYIVATCIAAVAVHRACYRADNTLVVALSWVVFPILPTSHLVDVGLVLAERTLFLPSVGVALLLKYAVDQICTAVAVVAPPSTAVPNQSGARIQDRPRTQNRSDAPIHTLTLPVALQGVVLAAVLGLTMQGATMTVARNEVWANNTALWESAYAAYPRSVKAMYAHASNVRNGTEAQLIMHDLLDIYPFHCYALASLQRYLLMDYYLDVEQAMAYAERATSSCYYGAGKKYLDTAMRDLEKVLETMTASSDDAKRQQGKRLLAKAMELRKKN
eukprot:m.1077976 g.1077976  ORF g.1077976 m.1077976 type:complete len:676 (+) comp24252_c0_seq9:116-2143(+)